MKRAGMASGSSPRWLIPPDDLADHPRSDQAPHDKAFPFLPRWAPELNVHEFAFAARFASHLPAEGIDILVGQEGDEGNVYGVELTEKGYLLLGSKPESLSKPLGEKMKDAAKAGAVEAGQSAVSNLVGMLMTAGILYLKNP